MRLAAASISIVQIQELVNIRGTGDLARIYGVEDNTQHAKVGKQNVFEATYRHSVQSFAKIIDHFVEFGHPLISAI
jgi:hypothetical protein